MAGPAFAGEDGASASGEPREVRQNEGAGRGVGHGALPGAGAQGRG